MERRESAATVTASASSESERQTEDVAGELMTNTGGNRKMSSSTTTTTSTERRTTYQWQSRGQKQVDEDEAPSRGGEGWKVVVKSLPGDHTPVRGMQVLLSFKSKFFSFSSLFLLLTHTTSFSFSCLQQQLAAISAASVSLLL